MTLATDSTEATVTGASRKTPFMDPPAFRLYVVGLPKSGTRSLAGVFAAHRSVHEKGNAFLREPALDYAEGLSDRQALLRRAGHLLDKPWPAVDASTLHHHYVEVLADLRPDSSFVHVIREPDAWVNSILHLLYRKRLYLQMSDASETPLDVRQRDHWACGRGALWPAPGDPDLDVVPALLDYRSQHLERMQRLLPADRTFLLRTNDIASRLGDLAAFAGVPEQTLDSHSVHLNAATRHFDRTAPFDPVAWDEYSGGVRAEMKQAVESNRWPEGGSPLGWM